MADEKISQLAVGGALEDTDLVPVARAGETVSVAGSEFGGSLPDPITTDVTISPPASATPPLLVEPTGDGGDVDALVQLVGPSNLHGGSGEGDFIRVIDDDGTWIFTLDPSGSIYIKPNLTEGVSGSALVSLADSTGFASTELRSGGSGHQRITIADPDGREIFRVGPLGEIVTGANTAPVDNTLQPSTCAIWFDSTNGAAKVMFKGKTADGTVVTGNLPLS